MALVFGAIAPHGWPTIPALSDDAAGALATRGAMLEVGRRAKAAGVAAIVLATPHGIRVEGAVAVAEAARGAGSLVFEGRRIEQSVPLDAALSGAIVAAARAAGLPVARVACGGHDRAWSVVPLDWGAMTPLWFLGHDRDRPGHGDVNGDPPSDDVESGPPVVIVSPARDLPRESLVAFGRVVGQVAEVDPRRVAFVASCDWAHAHQPDGAWGYDPAAAEVDAFVVQAIRDGDLARLLDLDERAAEAAAVDGLWQALLLVGASEVVPLRGELLSYEAPERYGTGMIVAVYGIPSPPQPPSPVRGRGVARSAGVWDFLGTEH